MGRRESTDVQVQQCASCYGSTRRVSAWVWGVTTAQYYSDITREGTFIVVHTARLDSPDHNVTPGGTAILLMMYIRGVKLVTLSQLFVHLYLSCPG